MFYENIDIKEIPADIQELYEKVKERKGQLVLDGQRIVKFVGLIRDKFDEEWCYRFLTYPSPYFFHRLKEVSDTSILCGTIIPLKGVLNDEDYLDLETSWRENEERCQYSKDWTTED